MYVRTLTDEEQRELEKGLRSSSAFTVRRCQILLSSVRRKTPSQIGAELHCSGQAVRNVVHAFEKEGLACLTEKSHARHDQQSAFDEAAREGLREMVHSSPRQYGHEASVWTLELLAKACWSEGISSRLVKGHNVSRVLREMGIDWRRAKHRIRSPDKHYAHRKKDETD